jgi:hypothetical protein
VSPPGRGGARSPTPKPWPGRKPCEPLASVIHFGELKDSSAAGGSSDRAAVGEVFYGGEMIVRHGIGQVLEVR